jgi:hypothetical protein
VLLETCFPILQQQEAERRIELRELGNFTDNQIYKAVVVEQKHKIAGVPGQDNMPENVPSQKERGERLHGRHVCTPQVFLLLSSPKAWLA